MGQVPRRCGRHCRRLSRLCRPLHPRRICRPIRRQLLESLRVDSIASLDALAAQPLVLGQLLNDRLAAVLVVALAATEAVTEKDLVGMIGVAIATQAAELRAHLEALRVALGLAELRELIRHAVLAGGSPQPLGRWPSLLLAQPAEHGQPRPVARALAEVGDGGHVIGNVLAPCEPGEQSV